MEIWLDSADASKIAGYAEWLPAGENSCAGRGGG